jgi:hypothetical protein
MFHRLTRTVVRMNGAPGMRQVYLPHPVMGRTAEQIGGYVYGASPVTGRPVMQEVIEGLTRGLAEATPVADRSTPRLVDPDTEENLHALFLDSHWTDTLPIVLPTEERVAAMLAHTSHAADEVVGRMQTTANRGQWEYTVEKSISVMPGARTGIFRPKSVTGKVRVLCPHGQAWRWSTGRSARKSDERRHRRHGTL